jgi:hypothetical protein
MKPASALEKRHIERVAGLSCLVSGKRPVTVHHVTGYADRMGRFTRSHRLVVPLAAEYHLIQHGPKISVEALGHRGFYQRHGIDLLAEAERLWAETLELERKAA